MNVRSCRAAALPLSLLSALALLPACGGSDDGEDGSADVGPSAAACEAPTPPSQAIAFAAPQAVAFAGRFLAVANTNGAWDAATNSFGFGPGSVDIIDPATGAIVNRIATTATNPQKLVVHGDRLFILNSGGLVLNAAGEYEAQTPASLDYLPIDVLDTAPTPHGHAELPPSATDARVGYPVDLAFVGERAYLTSGSANAIFVFNAGNGKWEHDAADPLWLGPPGEVRVSLGSITAVDRLMYVADFNTDTLYRIDGNDDAVSPCAVDLGESADLEGAGFPRALDGTLYYLMGTSGTIGHHPLADVEAAFADAACPALGLGGGLGALGMYPGGLEVLEDRLYVVESGENRVEALDTSGAVQETYNLPEGSNPYGLAFSADGRYLAVTELLSNGVTVFDRTCPTATWALRNDLSMTL